MPKEVRVSVRVSPALKARLHKAEEITGLPETQVVIRSLEAYCDYVEARGEFTMPFAIVPKNTIIQTKSEPEPNDLGINIANLELMLPDEEPLDLVAEEQAPYGAPSQSAAKKPL